MARYYRYDSSITQEPTRAQIEQSIEQFRAELPSMERQLAMLEQGGPVGPDSVTALRIEDYRRKISATRRAIATLESRLAEQG